MKLLETFKNIVNDVKPEICWFTTFNLNIELLEKYVLTAIAGKEPVELKRAEDYEALNEELIKYSIKVWYDYRALDLKHGKRTTVDLYPLNAAEVLDSKSGEPIFHPKVIFVKGLKTAYLLTGSFNLTIAGWSTNRECIAIKEIRNKRNALQVIEFFRGLDPEIAELRLLEQWAAKLPDEKPLWKFAHNFNTTNLLNELKGTELAIWSPYFSKNTTDLITEIKNSGFQTIHLIPDISLSQKVKIIPEELVKLQRDKTIRILTDQSIDKERQPLFHAKVWLSDRHIAIGSWNCSYHALGVKVHTSDRNIEAGIIETVDGKLRETLLRNLRPCMDNTITGTDAVEMDNEWLEVLKPYSFSCDIVANWKEFIYELNLTETDNNYYVELPHDPGNRFLINAVNGLSFIDEYARVLKNRLFTVYNDKGEVVYVGFLNEKGKEKRPVDGYVSFYDLFESLAINPLSGTSKSRVKYLLDEEVNGESDKESLPFFEYTGHESYYLMFVAFQKLSDTIHDNRSSAQKLNELGFRLPGSLINIKSLYKASSEKTLAEAKEDDRLFHYFMALEINECIRLFNQYSNKFIDTIETGDIEKLLTIDNNVIMDKKDLKFIKKAMMIK